MSKKAEPETLVGLQSKRGTMKRITIVAFVLFVALGIVAHSQKPSETERVDVPFDMQQSFALSQSRIATAEAQLSTARLAQENFVLKMQAEYCPKCQAAIDKDGKLYFERLKPSPQPERKP